MSYLQFIVIHRILSYNLELSSLLLLSYILSPSTNGMFSVLTQLCLQAVMEVPVTPEVPHSSALFLHASSTPTRTLYSWMASSVLHHPWPSICDSSCEWHLLCFTILKAYRHVDLHVIINLHIIINLWRLTSGDYPLKINLWAYLGMYHPIFKLQQ